MSAFGGPGKLVPIEWCHCRCDHCTSERHHLCGRKPTPTFHAFMLSIQEMAEAYPCPHGELDDDGFCLTCDRRPAEGVGRG